MRKPEAVLSRLGHLTCANRGWIDFRGETILTPLNFGGSICLFTVQ